MGGLLTILGVMLAILLAFGLFVVAPAIIIPLSIKKSIAANRLRDAENAEDDSVDLG